MTEVLVEPNVDLIPELKKRRPMDVVLNVGVGITEQSSAPYYSMSLKNDPAIGVFLAGHGYQAREMTFANTVFVDKELID